MALSLPLFSAQMEPWGKNVPSFINSWQKKGAEERKVLFYCYAMAKDKIVLFRLEVRFDLLERHEGAFLQTS